MFISWGAAEYFPRGVWQRGAEWADQPMAARVGPGVGGGRHAASTVRPPGLGLFLILLSFSVIPSFKRVGYDV